MKRNLKNYGILFLANTVGYLPLLLNHRRFIGTDWEQFFTPLSLFNRSALWYYGVYPLHFPWRCGGTDLAANPQTRIFSPMVALDFIFAPQLSMILTYFIFGLVGGIAMFHLLRHLKTSSSTAIVGAIVWMNSSWFALHFTEGHLVYADMQLLPLILLCTLRIAERPFRLCLVTTLALMVLDGAIQTVIYAGLVMACGLAASAEAREGIKQDKKTMARLIALLFLLTAIKVIPVWQAVGGNPPAFDRTTMPFSLVLTSLFYPLQKIRLPMPDKVHYVFHEFGCYLGILASLLILLSLRRKNWRRDNKAWLLLTLLWLWTGIGVGKSFNPWTAMEKIPLLNQAHLQSRTFILMFLFFTILVARALEIFQNKRAIWLALALLLIADGGFVRWHVMNSADYADSPAPARNTYITSDNLTQTVKEGIRVRHFLTPNTGGIVCNDRSVSSTEVTSIEDKTYRGEIYFTEGKGTATIRRFTPGQITIDYEVSPPATIAINNKHLFGWKSDDKFVSIKKEPPDRTLKLLVTAPKGTVTAAYRPPYLYPCLALFAVAILWWLWECFLLSFWRA